MQDKVSKINTFAAIFPLPIFLAILLFFVVERVAAEEQKDTQALNDRPGMELLGFLGEFSGENGKWIDPTKMDDMNIPDEKKDEDDSDD